MSDEVKWIKITTSMFDDEKIRVIHDYPEGASLILIWVQLLCMAGKTNANGYIFISENIPYTENSLASVLHADLNVLKLALTTFANMGMITIDVRGIFINNFAYYQNNTALQIIRDKWATEKRLSRQHGKELKEGNVQDNIQDNVQDMSKKKETFQARTLSKNTNVQDMSKTSLIDIDKEKDQELDIENKNKIPTTNGNVVVSDILSLYEKNFGKPLPTNKEMLIELVNQYGACLVKCALIEAIKKENKGIKYIEGICKHMAMDNEWRNNKHE